MVRTAKYCNVYQTVFHWFVPKTFDCKFSKSSYQGRYLARDLGEEESLEHRYRSYGEAIPSGGQQYKCREFGL